MNKIGAEAQMATTKITLKDAATALTASILTAGVILGVDMKDNSLNIADPIPAVVYQDVKEVGKHPYPHMRFSIDSLPSGKNCQLLFVCDGEMLSRGEYIVPEPPKPGWRISGVPKMSFNANPPHVDTSKVE